MTVRRGLSRSAVVDAATEIVETDGASALTLSAVARELGVKPPSLYNHVDSLEQLRRDVAFRAVGDLGDRLGAAAMGRAGRDALVAIADEVRTFATEHYDLYELTVRARPGDDEFARASLRAVEPLLAVFHGYDLDDVEAIHAARSLRATLHGFVTLEAVGGFGLDVDVDESFTWLVERLAETFEASAARSAGR